MINILLQILIAPLMTRIYTPEAYGLFAVFNSLTLNYSLISSLSYSSAILVSPKRNVVYALIALAATITILTGFFALILIAFFNDAIKDLFNIQPMGGWIYCIPVSAILLSLSIILSSLNIYHNHVKQDTKIVTSTNILNRIFNLLYGVFIKGTFVGLVLGDLVTKGIRTSFLLFGVSRESLKMLRDSFAIAQLRDTARAFRTYPGFVLPSSFLNAVSAHLPIYFFSIYFNSKEVGYLSFASTLLYIPVQVFGNSSASIFLKKASSVYHEEGMDRLKEATQKIYWNLFLLGLAGFSVILVFGDIIFGFAFGQDWVRAGQYSMYLAAYHIFLLVFTPLNAVFSVLRREKLLLVLHAGIFCVRAGSLYLGIHVNDALLAVAIFSVTNLISFLGLSLLVLKLVKVRLFKHASLTIALLVLVLMVVQFVRFLVIS